MNQKYHIVLVTQERLSQLYAQWRLQPVAKMLRHSMKIRFWDTRHISPLSPIQSCWPNFQVWSCSDTNFDKEGRGDGTRKIRDSLLHPKWRVVSQLFFATRCSTNKAYRKQTNKNTSLELYKQAVYSIYNCNTIMCPICETSDNPS